MAESKHAAPAGDATTVARRIAAGGATRIGFIPADALSLIPPVVESIATSLAAISEQGVASVLAPASASIAIPGESAKGLWTFSKIGAVSRFVPERAPEPGAWLLALGELLADSLSEREMVLVDFTGLDAVGELVGATALVDACCVVATNHRTSEKDIEAVAVRVPGDRFLGVLLVE